MEDIDEKERSAAQKIFLMNLHIFMDRYIEDGYEFCMVLYPKKGELNKENVDFLTKGDFPQCIGAMKLMIGMMESGETATTKIFE